MLSDMMLVMAWGLIFGTVITLILIPMLYLSIVKIQGRYISNRRKKTQIKYADEKIENNAVSAEITYSNIIKRRSNDEA